MVPKTLRAWLAASCGLLLAACSSPAAPTTTPPNSVGPAEQMASCVNSKLADLPFKFETIPGWDLSLRLNFSCGNLDQASCWSGLGDRSITQAVQNCQDEVPHFTPDYQIATATFDYAYCLLDQGLPVLTDSEGFILFVDTTCQWPCSGFRGAAGEAELAAVTLCRQLVPDYQPRDEILNWDR